MDLKFHVPILSVLTFFAFFVGTFDASPLNVKAAKTVSTTRLRRQAWCGGVLRADTGVIQLPTIDHNENELYEANTECKWKIKVPDGHHVVIDSEYFDLEASANCQYDYVRVVDASRNNTFCGKEHLVYVSISNELTVTFTSDNDVSGKGFKFKVTSVPNLTEGRCNSTILAINGQDGDIWNYDKPGNCFYSLEAPAGLTVQITLRFINFGSSSSDEKRIVIRDGVSTHGDHLWKISSGEPLRKKSACANHLFIEYHNQGSTKAVRFYLTYSILTCTTEPATHPPFVEGENDCGCEKQAVCVLQGFEKMCIPGSQCDVDLCANGATCVNTRRGDQCFCSGGFTGKLCNETAGSIMGHLKFIEVPQSRMVKKGGQSVSLCRVESPASEEKVVYTWYFKEKTIEDYKDRTKLRDGEGLLLINDFNVEFEGRYTCVARAGNVTAEHTITLSMDECFLGINGPKDTVDYTGRTVILSCSIEEAGDIWWEKDNVKIDIGGQFHIWQSKTINNLRIAIAEEQDSGVYTCVARDITGCKNRRSATLTVQNWGKHETYCGKSYPDLINEERASSRIAMGLNALPKENPWHVSLFSMDIMHPFCGGSLISQRFVVTAAHCITDHWTEEQFKASVVIEFASLSCILDGNERRGVKFIYIHPQYNKTAQFDSDIALLELSEPVEYSLNIRPICVQSNLKTEKYMIGASNTQGKAVGCGKVRHLGLQSLKLQRIMLPYVQRADCKDDLETSGKYKFTKNMICAGYKQLRVGDVCGGDSGGGFMMELPGGFKWVLAGIVSFGFGCNKPDHYSYFTHVGMFYDWIDSIAKFNDEKVKLDFLVTTRSDPESVVMHVTNASTVGRDNNCSGIWSDTDEGFTGYILYTAPKYEDNRHCVLVVHTVTNNHVVQVHFNRFELKDSDSCTFDSLNIYSGEREDSASLGGPYCASSLNGRTILSSGNTMRLVFKTDQSNSFLGFQANFTFLPMDHLDKDCRCSGHEVCVVRGFEKMCIAGSQCKSFSHCENGATCVNNGSVDHCYCTAGYTGNFCTEMAGSAGRLKFTHAPQSRTVKKGGESDNLCQVEKPASGPPVVYSWYFKGRIIGDYQRSSKFGDQGQGSISCTSSGELRRGSLKCNAPGDLTRGIKSITIHPQFNKTAQYDSNIALLELSEPVEYSDNVRPACVQDYSKIERLMIGSSSPPQGKAVGCGVLREGSKQQPNDLQQIYMPYVQRYDCEEGLEGTNYRITENTFCAGQKKRRVGDVCAGDSGGGFMMETPGTFQWVLAGIVSFGFLCDSPDHYSYFTNVGKFYGWIDGIAKFTDEKVNIDFVCTF